MQFFFRHRWALAGGAADDKAGNAAIELLTNQVAKRFFIDRAINKRRRQCGNDAVKTVTHLPALFLLSPRLREASSFGAEFFRSRAYTSVVHGRFAAVCSAE